MGVSSGRRFEILLTNFSDDPTQLAKNMVVATAETVPLAILKVPDLQAQSDDPPPENATAQESEDGLTLKRGAPTPDPSTWQRAIIPTANQGYEGETDHTGKRRSVVRTKRIDWQAQTERKAKEDEDWRDHVRLGTEFEDLRSRIERLLEPHEAMWDGTLGLIKATEHHIDLEAGSRPVHQPPYRAGPKQREMEKK